MALTCIVLQEAMRDLDPDFFESWHRSTASARAAFVMKYSKQLTSAKAKGKMQSWMSWAADCLRVPLAAPAAAVAPAQPGPAPAPAQPARDGLVMEGQGILGLCSKLCKATRT